MEKKIISVMLMIALMLTTTVTAFGTTIADKQNDAVEQEAIFNDDIKAFQIDDNTVLLSDFDSSAILKISENNGVVKYEVKEEGSIMSDYFLVDEKAGTIYSSQTGQTITTEELLSEDSTALKGDLSSANATATWPKTYSISYKKLRSVVSSTANKFTIAVAIVTVAAAIAGITISTAGGVVVALIGAGFVAIYEGLKVPKKTKGVRVKVDRKKVTEYHGNTPWTGYQYNIVKVWTY